MEPAHPYQLHLFAHVYWGGMMVDGDDAIVLTCVGGSCFVALSAHCIRASCFSFSLFIDLFCPFSLVSL